MVTLFKNWAHSLISYPNSCFFKQKTWYRNYKKIYGSLIQSFPSPLIFSPPSSALFSSYSNYQQQKKHRTNVNCLYRTKDEMDATSERPRSPLDLPPPPASVVLHPSAPPPPPPPLSSTEVVGNTTTTTTTHYAPKTWNDPSITTAPKIPVSLLSGAQPLPSVLTQRTTTSSYSAPNYSGKKIISSLPKKLSLALKKPTPKFRSCLHKNVDFGSFHDNFSSL